MRYTKNQDYIIDRLNADSWEQVVSEFENKTLEEIEAELCKMFPDTSNQIFLSITIWNEVNR